MQLGLVRVGLLNRDFIAYRFFVFQYWGIC